MVAPLQTDYFFKTIYKQKRASLKMMRAWNENDMDSVIVDLVMKECRMWLNLYLLHNRAELTVLSITGLAWSHTIVTHCLLTKCTPVIGSCHASTTL